MKRDSGQFSIPFRKTEKGVIVEVKVEPRSSKAALAGVLDTVVKVKLTAPPVGGAANEQLIELLSEQTGVRKSCIQIVKGHASKRKTVFIEGVSSL